MFTFQLSGFKSIQVSPPRQQELMLENALEHKSTYIETTGRHGLKIDATPSAIEKRGTNTVKDFSYSITGFKGRDYDKFDKVAKEIVATVQIELDGIYGKGKATASIKKEENADWKFFPHNGEIELTIECRLPAQKEESKETKSQSGFMKEKLPSWKKV